IMQVWSGGRIATMDARSNVPYGLIEDGALATREDGTIAWVGPRAALPAAIDTPAGAHRRLDGRLVTPGFVDAHTHAVYAGDRSRDFELRLAGKSYAEIAREGGGILSTVRATRAAGLAQLERESEKRVEALADSGVTTVEIKSGYGLDRDTEIAMLRVARALGERCDVGVRTTYLGLHARPPEFADADGYVDFVIDEMLPFVARERLADAVDAFCETIAFTRAQVGRFFEAARTFGFEVKLHADQLSEGGGAALAARYGALSADHLERASPEGLAALAAAGTVAVVLPGATYFLRETARPPVEAMRRLGIPIAVATDCNPGTSPLVSMPLALNLACTLLGLTPEEALAGATRNGARAVGLGGSAGLLAAGYAADFVVWDLDAPVQLAYAIGAQPVHAIVRGGRLRRAHGATAERSESFGRRNVGSVR
ncbi:MAG: imidazolonepropionase, partial [Candidatus Eremiobacteraeota bacterium]|nr:imidazolonepropionase [Candidatus Eremiobacteraeota bacterium]